MGNFGEGANRHVSSVHRLLAAILVVGGRFVLWGGVGIFSRDVEVSFVFFDPEV